MSEHTHKCGFDLPDHPFDIAKTEGCGFEWQHDPEAIPEDAMVQAHMCPQCKKGPWSWQYGTETVLARLSRFKSQKAMLDSALAEAGLLSRGNEYLDRITKILNEERSH